MDADTPVRVDLGAAGVGTAALVCPVIPHITDVMPLIDVLAPHTDRIRIYGLSVPEESSRGWQNVREILRRHFPDRRSAVEATVLDREHSYWRRLRDDLSGEKESRGLDLRIHV